MKYIVFILFVLMGCQSTQTLDKRKITVSILSQKYFIDRLSRGVYNVNVMVKMGYSPATYEPTPQQLKELATSGLYIKIGHLGYEQAWTDRFASVNSRMRIASLSGQQEYIKEVGHKHGDHVHEGGVDPHIWISPSTVLPLIHEMKSILVEYSPELREEIEKNYEALRIEIEVLHKIYQQELTACTKKSFMIFHPVLSYLARDYGLVQLEIEKDGKEPSAAHLQELILLGKAHDVKVIFIQEEFDKRNAQVIAEEIGASVITINPLAYDWTMESKAMLNQLKLALK